MLGIIVILFVSSLPSLLATSQGINTICNAEANMGCTQWKDGNRLECTDPNKGHMPWVMAPDRSQHYTVRTSDSSDTSNDPSTYIPDTYITIYIRALKYGWNYRGLLLHALDSANNDVGSWNFPATDHALFWSPPTCPKAAMHVSAELKPYGVQISFKTPPQGTGTITFKCLIKRGPANDGYFHYPKIDLVLTEAAPLPQFPKWMAANPGESCPDACQRDPLYLNDYSKMNKGIESSAFIAEISPYHACPLPVVSTCSTRVGTHFVSDGMCYHKGANCQKWRTEAVPTESYKLCPCQDASAPTPLTLSPTLYPTLSPTPPTPPTPAPTPFGWEETSAASANIIGISVRMCVAFAIILLSNRRINIYFLTLMLVLSFMGYANAHNWLETPGRASFQASTVAPCQPRKASDLHAQVSRDQYFTIKWATGHERDSWWVVLAGKDAHWLAHPDFEDMVDDYIENAPKNEALDAGLQRYHGFYHEDTTNMQNLEMYGSKIEPSNKNEFLTHKFAETTDLYKYTTKYLSGDKRVSYESAKYPWIESAFRYTHLYHLPHDYDVIKLNVPAKSGPGHYIVHWRWSGYYDCVDIDVRQDTVPHIYGIMPEGGGYVFNRIDHCQYIEPKEILTTCMDIPYDIEATINGLPSWYEKQRVGINCYPSSPSGSIFPAFAGEGGIPWNMNSDVGACSSSWNKLGGSITETPVTIDQSKITEHLGKKCSDNDDDWDTDLKRAIARCIGQGCNYISRKGSSDLFDTSQTSTFQLCYTNQLKTPTAKDGDWNSFSITQSALQTFPNQNGVQTTINFVPRDALKSQFTDTATLFTDSGKPYVPGGMGWNCKEGMQCDWCCRSEWDGCDNACCTPTMDSTFARFDEFCDNEEGLRTMWKKDVPNGIYEVTSFHDHGDPRDNSIDIGGCAVNGYRLLTDDSGDTPNPTTIGSGKNPSIKVEVTDGQLTLINGMGGNGCNVVNWLKYKKVEDVGNYDEIFIPGSQNPWWQLELTQNEPVGIVKISNFDYYDHPEDGKTNCASWWLFKGSKCYQNHPLGWFNGTEEGAVVGLSNTPCSSNNGCPTGTAANICGRIQAAGGRHDGRHYYVDCAGKTGKYVWVQLPGNNRILTVDIGVYRVKPSITGDTTVCYGVHAREQTQTTPEFIISNDPEDPIFYGTCYSREFNITWLGIDQDAPSPSRWRFNNHCMDCGVYHANKQSTAEPWRVPQKWLLADGECMNCELETPPVPIITHDWIQPFVGECRDNRDSKYHEDLPNCASNFECRKQIFANGRHPDDHYNIWSLNVEECKILANKDSECSSVIEHHTYWWGVQCFCWKKHECCGRCTPSIWYGEDDTPPTVYKYGLISDQKTDPTCANGTKSSDDTLCCPSYCVNAKDESVCGVEWRCYNEVVGGGTCCKESFVKKCSESDAPCLL